MTTLRQLVTDGLRESGIIAVGATPDGDEFEEAFARLQNLITSLYGYELGDPFQTLDYEDVSDCVPANCRLIVDAEQALTIDMPLNPRDGARFGIIDNAGNFATYNVTLDGNGRKIETTDTVVLSTDSLNREWFYRADLGTWVRVSVLTESDESPFPSEFDDFLITMLASRLNNRYAAITGTETYELLKRMRVRFRARYRQVSEQMSDLGLLRLGEDRYVYGDSDFNRGS
jgi:hypothetical protein